jgi:hypothetical protein
MALEDSRGRGRQELRIGVLSRDPAVLTSVCVQADLDPSPMCKVHRAVESPLRGYNDLQGGFEELWSIVAWGRERNREPLRCLVRGVSNVCEGSKMLTFLFRSPPVCSSLLHLRLSWKEFLRS